MKEKPRQTWPEVSVCVFLVLAVLAVFGQTSDFQFVNYDDPQYVYENPVVEQGLSAKGVGFAFTHKQVANWIPLTTLSHELDCQLFGLRAGRHHLVNVLLHAANAVLLFLVLRRMTGSLWRCAFVAALFAVHPLRAESVAWVSERKDVLSGFFFLLAIGAYARQARKPSRAGNVAVMLLFVLGLMAKSMVATLPFVLLLLDYWPLGRMRGKENASSFAKATEDRESGEEKSAGVPFWGLVREKIPLFAIAAAFSLVAAMVPGLVVKDHRMAFLERLGNALVSYVVYLRQMVFPAGLFNLYPYAPNGEPMWKVGAAFVALAGITAAVLLRRKKNPCLLMGWLWYLGMLVPVIGIIPISADAAHADRYTYLPGIGLAVAGTWALADWSAGWKHRRVILGGLMAGVVGILALWGHSQTSYWQDTQTLWLRALECDPNNSTGLDEMGFAFFQKGDFDKAIAQYQMALKIKPDFARALGNLGAALLAKGDLAGAIAQSGKALELDPDYADAHMNLGVALAKSGRPQEAIAQYRKALELKPGAEEAHVDLGLTLLSLGRVEAAIAEFRRALEIRPNFDQALCDLGNAFLVKPDLAQAIGQYQKALEINPNYLEARRNLGRALLRKGDFDAALACFEKIEKNTAASADPMGKWWTLGNDLLKEKNLEEAIVCYRQVLKINAGSASLWANLGLASFQNGEIKQAIDAWQQALQINPDQIAVQNSLAWALATTAEASLRDGAKAVALAERANQLSRDGNPAVLRTLAAAYAEMGRYGDATAAARRALDLATRAENDTLTAALQKEIKLYEVGAPVREPAR
ncbi:MAG: tetratricopeptide repeat protein [Verrucomicrobiota bacterium]